MKETCVNEHIKRKILANPEFVSRCHIVSYLG